MGDAGVKTEGDFDIPEDTQPSAEEEEQLQKKTGEVEFNLFKQKLASLEKHSTFRPNTVVLHLAVILNLRQDLCYSNLGS